MGQPAQTFPKRTGERTQFGTEVDKLGTVVAYNDGPQALLVLLRLHSPHPPFSSMISRCHFSNSPYGADKEENWRSLT